ncbi:hypothetical protein NECAME_09935 [Necator americanus]|uniref:Uncharacterized protein n=1 Tax=Necator americanus TaxID=51031 RepID=W2TDX0_NECAM|nr:hypothetical protein NECAME_09935 [Necator americanus]ETN79217.1 hypothetical protein NECAME_09935 [Necator americanus]
MIDCGSVFRDRKKSCDSDEFRRRSGSSRSDGKRWGRKDTGGGELRCCIQPDLLRSNVDKHWFFEDEQVSSGKESFLDGVERICFHRKGYP